MTDEAPPTPNRPVSDEHRHEPSRAEHRQAQADQLFDTLEAQGPALGLAALAIVQGLGAILDGSKVIAIQHIERPIAEREDAGCGQWDSYIRVLDAEDDDTPPPARDH